MPQSTYSLSFDGSDDYVDVGTVTSGVKTTFTIFGWVKKPVAGDMAFWGWGATSQNRQGVLWFSDDNLYFFAEAGSNNFPSVALSPGATWHHVALVFDGGLSAADRVKGYVDGVLQTLSGASNPASITIGGNFLIGREADLGRYTKGLHDDVGVSASALSGATIAGLAAGSTDPASLTLLGLWRLEEGSGTSTADASGNGNAGTLTLGPTWSSDVPPALAGAGVKAGAIYHALLSGGVPL